MLNGWWEPIEFTDTALLYEYYVINLETPRQLDIQAPKKHVLSVASFPCGSRLCQVQPKN